MRLPYAVHSEQPINHFTVRRMGIGSAAFPIVDGRDGDSRQDRDLKLSEAEVVTQFVEATGERSRHAPGGRSLVPGDFVHLC